MKVRDKKIIEKINLLRKEIEEHNRKYYVENNPVISDFEYDMLMQDLISLERDYPDLAVRNSPTNRVGSDLATSGKSQFEQAEHRYPMLSLGNTYDKAEIL
ncbi:MAG: NAD-dependent DNA ligase LigA, partial [Bacteroidales bacterium]|nr:NAD-dependent DNA ligase LigA [Bacteroidales bacterium]